MVNGMASASDDTTIDVAELRRAVSMTQVQMAAVLGVSQAAVSQFEGGHRNPSGPVLAFYERLDAATRADTVIEPRGRMTTTMPAARWVRVVDPEHITAFSLPVRLDWSPRVAEAWDYGDEVHRRELYRLLIDVGGAIDVIMFVDVDELAAWSDELLVSRDARGVLDRLVDRTSVHADA